MFAAVDLGSNSFRLHIGRYEGGVIRVVKSAREPVRLGAGLDSKGNLTSAAMETALDCLSRFGAVLSAYPLTAVRVVATNTLRIAGNAQQFLLLAEKVIQYPIEIISGEEEGRLIYLGVASTLVNQDERRLVIDIGGGSTELVLGQGQAVEQVESFGIGTARHNCCRLRCRDSFSTLGVRRCGTAFSPTVLGGGLRFVGHDSRDCRSDRTQCTG
jgi:exopolyphosphatase/guanosine-5'-triphosphate,3'-diphosphate pyrophosphatase